MTSKATTCFTSSLSCAHMSPIFFVISVIFKSTQAVSSIFKNESPLTRVGSLHLRSFISNVTEVRGKGLLGSIRIDFLLRSLCCLLGILQKSLWRTLSHTSSLTLRGIAISNLVFKRTESDLKELWLWKPKESG